jgi:hypothetical protein
VKPRPELSAALAVIEILCEGKMTEVNTQLHSVGALIDGKSTYLFGLPITNDWAFGWSDSCPIHRRPKRSIDSCIQNKHGRFYD